MSDQEVWEDSSLCAIEAKKDEVLAAAWIQEDHPLQAYAKKVCLRCPVRLICIQDALEDEEAQGVRGGYEFDAGTLPVAVAREIRDTLGLKIGAHQSTGRPKK